MQHTTFFKYLVFTTLFAVALSLLQYTLPVLETYVALALWSTALFTVLNVVMYGLTYRIVVQSRQNQFIGIFMVFTLFKMILAVGIVGLYAKYMEPPNRFFVLPFFLIYLIYTAFELWFMDKLGRTKPKQ